MDDYPEAAFFNAGTIDDVKRKAEELKKRPLGGIHQHQHPISINFKDPRRNSRPAVFALRRFKPQLTCGHSAHRVTFHYFWYEMPENSLKKLE